MGLFIFRLPLNVNMVTEDFAAGGLLLGFAAYREQGQDFAPRKKRFQAAFKHQGSLKSKIARQRCMAKWRIQ